MSLGDNAKRLGTLVRERRKELKLTQSDVQNAGGPSTATLRLIEGGRQGDFRQSTIDPLERILKWQPGSVERALKGGTPSPWDESDQVRDELVNIMQTGVETAPGLPPARPVSHQAVIDLYHSVEDAWDALGDIDIRSLNQELIDALASMRGTTAQILTEHFGPEGVKQAYVYLMGWKAEADLARGQIDLLEEQEKEHGVEDATQPHAPSETSQDQKTIRSTGRRISKQIRDRSSDTPPPPSLPDDYDLAANKGRKGIPDFPSEAEQPQAHPDDDA